MSIVIRPNTRYNVAMRVVPYCILAITFAFTRSVLAQSQNEEVIHVPPIAFPDQLVARLKDWGTRYVYRAARIQYDGLSRH